MERAEARLAAAYDAGSPTVAGSGRKRSLALALSESRSGDQASCQTSSTVAVSTPGRRDTADSMSPSTVAANGHQPEVSISSTRAAPPSISARCNSPMSTTEIPLSRQHGS